MVAIMGQFLQETLTGQGPIEQIATGHVSPFGTSHTCHISISFIEVCILLSVHSSLLRVVH
jgi:hypothetical protein